MFKKKGGGTEKYWYGLPAKNPFDLKKGGALNATSISAKKKKTHFFG